MIVEKAIPLKQGLKLQLALKRVALERRRKGNSIKTRIETCRYAMKFYC